MVIAQRIATAALVCGVLAAALARSAGHTVARIVIAGLLVWIVVSALGFVVAALRTARDPEDDGLVRPPRGGG